MILKALKQHGFDVNWKWVFLVVKPNPQDQTTARWDGGKLFCLSTWWAGNISQVSSTSTRSSLEAPVARSLLPRIWASLALWPPHKCQPARACSQSSRQVRDCWCLNRGCGVSSGWWDRGRHGLFTILATSEGLLLLRHGDVVLVQGDEIEGATILSTSDGLLVLEGGDVVLVQGDEIEGATACWQS